MLSHLYILFDMLQDRICELLRISSSRERHSSCIRHRLLEYETARIYQVPTQLLVTCPRDASDIRQANIPGIGKEHKGAISDLVVDDTLPAGLSWNVGFYQCGITEERVLEGLFFRKNTSASRYAMEHGSVLTQVA